MVKKNTVLKPQLWVWTTSEKHWEYLLKNKIWSAQTEKIAKKINKQDKILIYVPERKMFTGIISISSNYTERDHPKWPQEMDVSKTIWRYDWNVKIELLLEVYFKDVKWLPFIQEKINPGLAVKGHSYGPSNSGKPLSTVDIYALQGLIVNNMTRLFSNLWETRPTFS